MLELYLLCNFFSSPVRGIYCDILHIFDLQILPDSLWSSILELTNNGQQSLLNNLWHSYSGWCKDNRIDHSARAKQKLFNRKILVSPTSYTHLSQKFLKGLAARMMIFWITPILHEEALKHPQDVHQVYRANLFIALSRIYSIVAEQPKFLSYSAKEEIQEMYLAFRDAYSFLASSSLRLNILRWPVYPKLHASEHLLLSSQSVT
ncbi:Uncharacterized protein SCF082_LOCUS9197 [Durusdinium trenchii]|uniref:Uncharacterized protein n=1 Tax=Durusdinium trenchii TaxID=1381693 RepID=A0ABP0IXL8_9DINO